MFQANRRRNINLGSGFVDAVFIHQDGAFEDQSLGLVTALDKSAVKKQFVNTLFVTFGGWAAQFFGCTVNNGGLEILL